MSLAFLRRSKSLLCVWLLLFFSCTSHLSAVFLPSRLKCLQYIHQLGRENITTDSDQWTRSTTAVITNELDNAENLTDANDVGVKPAGWVYNAPRCPLLDFDKKAFCTHAIGCDKRVLLVGDSTLQAWMIALRLVLGASDCSEQRQTPCPARYVPRCVPLRASTSTSSRPFNEPGSQHCDPSTHWGTNTAIHDMTACAGACPQNSSGVHITFMRHDFLNEVHGRRWYKDSVCDYWWEMAMQYDYLVLSFGPHLEAVLDNPYTSPRASQGSDEDLFKATASAFTKRLEQLYQSSNETKKPLLIYRSGPVGVGNYSRDCDEPPQENMSEIVNSYDWPLIPLVNEIYIKSILKSFSSVHSSLSSDDTTPVLIMDTSALMSKIKSCRVDFMHFKLDGPSSPVLLELQILFNLLSEHHHITAAAATTAAVVQSGSGKSKKLSHRNKNNIYRQTNMYNYDNFSLRNVYIVVSVLIAVGGFRYATKLIM